MVGGVTLLVATVPRWVKVAAAELGAMVGILKGDPTVLSLVPLEEGSSSVHRAFAEAEYVQDPDECWRLVLAAYPRVRA